MTISRRIVLALAATAALGGVLIAAAPAAQAQSSWNLWQENGSGCSGNTCAVGSDTLNAGDQVKQVSHPGRTLTTPSSGGLNEIYVKFSNGNFMAANAGCNGVTIKSSASSDGVVWIKFISGGHEWLINRYCQNNSFPQTFLGGNGSQGVQWTLCFQVQGGCFTKINFHAT